MYYLNQVVILSLESLAGSNVTRVVFGVDPDPKSSKLLPTSQSLIRETFVYLVTYQSLRLNTSLFGPTSLFEVLKFPGGITIIPPQNAFLLQKVQILFNFTLNFSIHEIQENFDELKSQLKSGLHLAPYEVSLSYPYCFLMTHLICMYFSKAELYCNVDVCLHISFFFIYFFIVKS